MGAVAQVCFIKKKCKVLVFLQCGFSKYDKLGRISSFGAEEMTHQLRKYGSYRGPKFDSRHPPVTLIPGDTVPPSVLNRHMHISICNKK